MADILDPGVRKLVIEEILGEENQKRKEESLKRFEIYRERQRLFLERALLKEFSKETVDEFRKVTSVNLAKRIVDELASIYTTEPSRTFQTKSGELSENELEQINNLYAKSTSNVKLKRANRWFELFDQGAIQVLPMNGIVDARVLAPHQYDVIPKDSDPETGEVYIISIFDKHRLLSGSAGGRSFELSDPPSFNSSYSNYYSDYRNQKIGDADDFKKAMNFVWWSKDWNFITDGRGSMLDESGNVVIQPNESEIMNPIQTLPFIDIAREKDFEFWVRHGSSVTEFSIEFLVLLCDIFNIHKMQGYSQAIIFSEKVPANMRVGPNHILHIPLDPNKEVQPRFEFASPSPDMASSLELAETFMRLFLTSRGIDPKTVSGKAETQRFSSGIERLLAMIEKFEASKDSIDIFRGVEDKYFELMKKWSNAFQGVTKPNGKTEPLIDDLRIATIPEDAFVTVQFKGPEIVQTKSEREDSVIKQMQEGLLSRTEAIQEIRGVEEEVAKEIVQKIDSEMVMLAPRVEDGDSEGQIPN
jgi:hypothetical protein